MAPNALKTITNKCPEFRRWYFSNNHLKKKFDVVTQVGLKCSEVYKTCIRPDFKRFEKDDKEVRAKCENHDFEKIARLRNVVTNRKETRVTHQEKPGYIIDAPVYSLLKWPGGKQSELRLLLDKNPEMFPSEINNYYEPFVGGGAVYFSISANKIFINDKCEELIKLYTFIKQSNKDFYKALNKVASHWNSISDLMDSHRKSLLKLYKSGNNFANFLRNHDKFKENIWGSGTSFRSVLLKIFAQKISKVRKVEKKNGELSDDDIIDNIESAIKASSYTFIRDMYNNSRKYKLTKEQKVVCFYFLRDYCFSSMFRFNKYGEFNVPYGGISYNKKMPDFRRKKWQSDRVVSHLKNTTMESLDFDEFFTKHPPGEGDFIFVDPPYDSEFSTYAKSKFGQKEHERLAKYLIHTKANFMLIIKNTEFISSLYTHNGISRIPFSKKYAVSFMDRNDQSVEHLIITNY